MMECAREAVILPELDFRICSHRLPLLSDCSMVSDANVSALNDCMYCMCLHAVCIQARRNCAIVIKFQFFFTSLFGAKNTSTGRGRLKEFVARW